ncbi:MAG: translation initiation factor IF-2 [Patescibacteria group bacterium]
MNVTELARQFKVTTSELFDKLPALGFDIGRRAIKVDDRIANKIIEAWKSQVKHEREISRIAEIRGEAGKENSEPVEEKIIEVRLPSVIVVREFAALLNLPVNKVLVELMKNGVLTSMNERIDFDTASIVGEELGFKIVADDQAFNKASSSNQQKLEGVLKEKTINCQSRPPVVVVMGHVDHGKTKILDAIRKTDVVASESGGITQHIGAYQVHKKDCPITFIDTPGHEAFTAMRSRGARVADIAILVIAADDGVRPQTKEAIKIIQDNKLPFIVAINKIDKPEANIEKVKQDLAALNLLSEDWGGRVICVPVSAKAFLGIDDLLETILLVAEMEKENIFSDPSGLAVGTIIESHIDKGEGPVATILVQKGTLKIGDILSMDNTFYGKVRGLKNHKGETITAAAPSTPAKILGLKIAPAVGSILAVADSAKDLTKDVKQHRINQEKDFSTHTRETETDSQAKYINLVIKADVLGSVEAIIESLAKLETAEVKIKIIGKGLGIITEADILKAEATKAKVIGFHVKPSVQVADLARDKGVTIKTYQVIYHLIEDTKKEIESLKEKEVVRKLIGQLEILKVFRREAGSMIVGGRVIDGGIFVCDTVIVTRGGAPVASGKVNRLECSRQAVDKVHSGQECGINFEGKAAIEVGDVLEFYQEAKSV